MVLNGASITVFGNGPKSNTTDCYCAPRLLSRFTVLGWLTCPYTPSVGAPSAIASGIVPPQLG